MLDTIFKPLTLQVEMYSLADAPVPEAKPGGAALRYDVTRTAGLEACMTAWSRARDILAHNWQSLPCAEENALVVAALSIARTNFRNEVSLAAIASEVEHALEHGLRSTTPLACMLLANIALEWFDGGHDAMALANAALDIAVKTDSPDYICISLIYANFFWSLTAELDRGARTLAQMGIPASQPLHEQLQSVSTAFTSGIQLTELAQHLDKLNRIQNNPWMRDESHSELSLRCRLLKALRCPQVKPSLEDLGQQRAIYKNRRYGYWLTHLQTFWFAGNFESARVASERAAVLRTRFSTMADIVCYHLFSILTYSRLVSPNAVAAGTHLGELNRLARNSTPGVSTIAELAAAVHERCTGNRLGVLSSLDQAYRRADRLGQHWVAAIAAEEAARAAVNSGLHTAVDHYRRCAMMSYGRWGAFGRIAMLKREWQCARDQRGREDSVENHRSHRQSEAEEIALSISHEINQPLAAIILQAAAAGKWLSRAQPNVERALESLSVIGEAVRHARDIVRVTAGVASHGVYEVEPVDVDQTINDVLRLLQSTLSKHGIQTKRALNLRGAGVLANRVQLKQVVTNLVANAIEALSCAPCLDRGRSMTVQSGIVNGHEVEIIVEDNGPGIAPLDRDRIFSRLFTTKGGNRGLGLSISNAIVRAHDGRIEFAPGEPCGARFRVRLPLRSA